MTTSDPPAAGDSGPAGTGSSRSPPPGVRASTRSSSLSDPAPAASSGDHASRCDPPGASSALHAVGAGHVRRVARVSDAFFEAQADQISRTCRDMARRFHRGGRLLVFATPGPVESDAYHVSVEFVHPVLVGKQALPATVLARNPAAQVRSLGRPDDIAMGITSDGAGASVSEGLRAAGERGLLTLGLAGGSGGGLAEASPDHLFVIPDEDPTVVQEVQETLYHVLWELVHVFFEHKGLL